MRQMTHLSQSQSGPVKHEDECTHGVRRQRACSRVMRVRHPQQAMDIFVRINVGDEARRSIGHRGREDSMLHVTAAGCKTEKTVECLVLLEPKVRNLTTFDRHECLAMSARESVHFEVSRLPEKCLQNISWPDVQIAQSSFVLDELFDGGSEFHWRPPN